MLESQERRRPVHRAEELNRRLARWLGPFRDADGASPALQHGIRLSEHLDSDGETIFRHACALGAEGIVAKRRDRPYRSGRCVDWVKIKNPGCAGGDAHHGVGVMAPTPPLYVDCGPHGRRVAAVVCCHMIKANHAVGFIENSSERPSGVVREM